VVSALTSSRSLTCVVSALTSLIFKNHMYIEPERQLCTAAPRCRRVCACACAVRLLCVCRGPMSIRHETCAQKAPGPVQANCIFAPRTSPLPLPRPTEPPLSTQQRSAEPPTWGWGTSCAGRCWSGEWREQTHSLPTALQTRHQIQSPKRPTKSTTRGRLPVSYRSRICLNGRRNTNLARETRTLCPVGRTSLSPWDMGMTSELLTGCGVTDPPEGPLADVQEPS
jgi:hypothetical protein